MGDVNLHRMITGFSKSTFGPLFSNVVGSDSTCTVSGSFVGASYIAWELRSCGAWEHVSLEPWIVGASEPGAWEPQSLGQS